MRLISSLRACGTIHVNVGQNPAGPSPCRGHVEHQQHHGQTGSVGASHQPTQSTHHPTRREKTDLCALRSQSPFPGTIYPIFILSRMAPECSRTHSSLQPLAGTAPSSQSPTQGNPRGLSASTGFPRRPTLRKFVISILVNETTYLSSFG